MIYTILLGLLLILFVYQFQLRTWRFFNQIGLKYIRGFPFVGSFYKTFFFVQSLHSTVKQLYSQFPDEQVCGLYYPAGMKLFLIRDPSLIRQLASHQVNRVIMVDRESDQVFGRALQFMRGSVWKEVRSAGNVGFALHNLKAMSVVLNEFGERLYHKLNSDCQNGILVCNMKPIFGYLTSDILARFTYGLDNDSLNDVNNTFHRHATSISTLDFKKGVKLMGYTISSKIMNFFRISIVSNEDRKYFRKLTENQLKNVTKGELNFLSLLVNSLNKNNNKSKMNWTIDDYSTLCISYLFGGIGQTTTLLSLASYELVTNTYVQKRLQEEIDSVHQSLHSEPLTIDILNTMQYLNGFIMELLRKWTSFAGVDREIDTPVTLKLSNDRSIDLKVGDRMIFPIFAIHFDEKYFTNPEEFNPDRFCGDIESKLLSAYMPFGVGIRSCIAYKFIHLVMKTMLFHLLLNFDLELCPATVHPIKLKIITLTPDSVNGYWVRIRKRKMNKIG